VTDDVARSLEDKLAAIDRELGVLTEPPHQPANLRQFFYLTAAKLTQVRG
jgi:hypothetical protein